MDLSKLTDEQLEIAGTVAKKAQEKGLNPDFVLPMVMAESGFNPKAESKKGAIGVMQVTPDTADFYKCKDPKDLNQNIDCGLSVLSDLVSKKHIGNDPYKVLSGYNAGPNTKYFTTGKIEDLPDETINHMDKVSSFFGGALPSVKHGEQAPAAEETKSAEGAKPAEDGDNKPVPTGSNAAGSPPDTIMGAIGAVTGAKVAGGIETGKQALPVLHNLLNKATGSDAYMTRPQSRASLQRYLNSQLEEGLRIPLAEFEKVAGGGKPVRTMSEIQDALANIKEVPEQKIVKPVYKPQAYGSTTLIDTGKVMPSTIPGKPAIDLSAYKYNPTMVGRAVDQATNAADVVRGALPSVAKVGVGALGGALAGKQLYDAFDQYKKEGEGLHMPSLRNAAQFSSGLGGAIGMVPTLPTQIIGGLMQAPELAYQGYDAVADMNERRKHATKEDTNRMLTNVDIMGNPIP